MTLESTKDKIILETSRLLMAEATRSSNEAEELAYNYVSGDDPEGREKARRRSSEGKALRKLASELSNLFQDVPVTISNGSIQQSLVSYATAAHGAELMKAKKAALDSIAVEGLVEVASSYESAVELHQRVLALHRLVEVIPKACSAVLCPRNR